MNPEAFTQLDIESMMPLLTALRAVKRPRTAAPTHTPKNLIEQFELYENGGTCRLYLYVGNTWRYVALT